MKFPENIERSLQALRDKKAQDLVVIDLKGISSFTDYFLIATASSTRHSRTLSDFLQESLKASPLGVEGEERGEWVLLDYGDFVVHIFTREKREYYDLESLWMDGRFYRIDEDNI